MNRKNGLLSGFSARKDRWRNKCIADVDQKGKLKTPFFQHKATSMILGKLVIDWTQMPTYNTIMAVAAGSGLCSIAQTARRAAEKKQINPEGWTINFGILGSILFLTGLHMTLTWPMAKYFPFDNIIFGEPSLAFGALLLGLAFYCWKKADRIRKAEMPLAEMAVNLRHLRYFLYGLGLALIAIGFAGVTFQLFAAPPEEPITGLFADYPMLEATAISGLYALVGISALLIPGLLNQFAEQYRGAYTRKQKLVYVLLMVDGLVWIGFGALNFFTHIGLIVNTMG